MRMNGEIACDLDAMDIKLYGGKKSGKQTRLANIKLKNRVARDDAAKRFGDDFLRVAFCGTHEIDGEIRHDWTKLTSPNIVAEAHEVNLLGNVFKCTPDVSSIETVDGEDAVCVTITFPMECTSEQSKAVGSIGVKVGELVKASFETIQLPLPLSKEPTGPFGNPEPFKSA